MSVMSACQLYSIPEPIYASFFFGTVLTTAFYGVACMQTFFYFVHYENDPLSKKILVASMWALNSVHEALSVSAVYKYVMTVLVDPSSCLDGNPELVLMYIITSLVAAPTQCFFIYRLYIFSGKKIIVPLILLTLVLVACVLFIVYGVEAAYTANGVQVVKLSVLNTGIFALLGTVSFSITAGIDVLIAIFMTFLLIRERITIGFAGTARILQLLVLFAVNTGIWTAIFALLIILLLHLFPDKAYYSVFVIPLGSVYCNTLLANLNVRLYLKDTWPTHAHISLFGTHSALPVISPICQNTAGPAACLDGNLPAQSENM